MVIMTASRLTLWHEPTARVHIMDHAQDFPEPPRPKPTGRMLVLLERDANLKDAARGIEKSVGGKAIGASSFATADAAQGALLNGDVVIFERFNVAVVPPSGGDTRARIRALQSIDGVKQVRPEFYLFAISQLRGRYEQWVRDGLKLLADGALVSPEARQSSRRGATDVVGASAAFSDTVQLTWGLVAVRANDSPFTGREVNVAILDTGLDLAHPDFADRRIVSESFVSGETPQDVQGHGTHCAGTVAGPMKSNVGSRRYGVAPDAELHIGKVLNNGGVGTETGILQGMNWAIDRKCAVISMSLGRPTAEGEKEDPLYEDIGAAALREGSLIIAAAGNESARDFNFIAPVGAPANSASIMAVGAVDPGLKVAPFSCGGLNSGGGSVDIAAPGVAIYSSFPMPRATRVLQGTSMACPHVAGVAALWAESDASLRGIKLWQALQRSATELGAARDFGRGLVQAPV